MEGLPSGLREMGEQSVECWDDDDFQCADDIPLLPASTTTSVTSSSIRLSGHRDSISSRRSFRSDSNIGDDDKDWHLFFQENDESAIREATISAKTAGIPIPPNIPPSALLGGTIKRLRANKARKGPSDDWSDDIEFLEDNTKLELKPLAEDRTLSDTLQQLDDLSSTPLTRASKLKESNSAFVDSAGEPPKYGIITRDSKSSKGSESYDLSSVIKDTKRPSLPSASSERASLKSENYEDGLELPVNDEPLRLSTRRDISTTPDTFVDDFDIEWAEGSIGVRFGGTKRDGMSNRTSSRGALSPSVSSCITAESEDEGLDGLHLPDDQLDLEKALQRRYESRYHQYTMSPSLSTGIENETQVPIPPSKDDFFSGIDIGDGDVFNANERNLNRNIKRKFTQPISSSSPQASMSITFTNKIPPNPTRIPRLAGFERPHSTQLEPVSESGAPVSTFRRPASRLTGHGVHSSVSSIPLPSSSLSNPPSSTRRPVLSGSIGDCFRSEPTTTGAQLLRAKRSVPVMRNIQTPVSPLPRPSSRQDGISRPSSAGRTKTPVDRCNNETRFLVARRPQVPFLPAGVSQQQSHHIAAKSRALRRAESDASGDVTSTKRSMSSLSNIGRSANTGRRGFGVSAPLLDTTKQTVTRPIRRRQFGDGTELDIFDDLPTSASAESKFVKNPLRRGAPKSLKKRPSQVFSPSPFMGAGTSQLPPPPNASQLGSMPRFARDTNASRNAREQRLASITDRERVPIPLAPLNTGWKSQIPIKQPYVQNKMKRGKGPNDIVRKPQLIKPMGSGVHEPKCKCVANPFSFDRWLTSFAMSSTQGNEI